MANSSLNNLRRCLWLALLASSLLHAAGLPTGNITVESNGAEVDGRTKLLVLPKVRITQDGYAIEADVARATGLEFNDSQWVFTGNVLITTPDGSSKADQATVLFARSQITELHIVGKPATFEQHDANKQTLAQGRAELIDYDLEKNTVRLSQQAWVKYGQNEFTGTTVVYNILTQRILANQAEQQGERVRITINPNASVPSGGKAVPKAGETGHSP